MVGLNLTAFTEYSRNNKYDKLQIFKSPLKQHYLTHEWNIPSYFTKGKCNTHDAAPMNTPSQKTQKV
jgi:hypothetical protein